MTPLDMAELRRRRLLTVPPPNMEGSFNPTGMEDPNFIPPQMNYDAAARMRELYQPSTTNIDKFDQHIDQYPQQPTGQSGLRKVGAILAGGLTDIGGGNGDRAFRPIMYGDYDRQMQDWKNKTDPLKDSANIERQTNANERMGANSVIASEMRDRTINETNRKNLEAERLRQDTLDARVKNDETRTKIAQQRANIYELKTNQKHLRFDFSGPYVIVTDPSTGQIFRTDIETGNLTDTEKLTLDYENASKLIGKRGDETRKNITAKGEVDTELENKRQTNRVELKTTPTGNLTERGMTPQQVKVHQYNMARLLKNSRPDLAPYITLDSTRNDFTIDLKKTPADKLAEIQRQILGGNAPTSASITVEQTKQVRNKETGEEKTAYSYDGGKTWTFERKVK